MITAILAFVFLWSLLYGRIPEPYLLLICAGMGVFLALVSAHRHRQFLSIDILAQSSRLKAVNPTLKFWTLFILMIVSVASKSIYTGIFLLLAMLMLAVFAGGVKLRHYMHILALPVMFLLIGGLALLFTVSAEPSGVLNIKVCGLWLFVSANAQIQTSLIISRALGAVSCLCFLSMTTPLPDIIGVLRRSRCPELMIDLMYLIYRYIFILLSLYHEMCNAAKSRLGFRDHRTGLRAHGKILANLLERSYHFAGKNFDAMESRCYDTGIRFLEHSKPLNCLQISVSALLMLVCLYLSFLAR